MTQSTHNHPKKTLRGAALAIAECLHDNYDDVRDSEYQHGRFKNRVYTPSGGDYYTATSGKEPHPAHKTPGWEDRVWKEITPDWYRARFNNRVFILAKT